MSASHSAPASDDAAAVSQHHASSSASPLSELATPPPPDAFRADEQQSILGDIVSLESMKSEAGVGAPSSLDHSLPAESAPEIKTEEDGAQNAWPPSDRDANNNSKKRKRLASPPWTFPTAENTTLKSADGRRVSARVNLSTPTLSENEEGRGRSKSQSMARSRPASPPWKKFQAEGPTSMVVDGKRMSGRVNRDINTAPKRVSPRSQKQQPASYTVHKRPYVRRADKAEGQGNVATDSVQLPDGPSPLSAASRIAELQAQIDTLQPAERTSINDDESRADRPKRRGRPPRLHSRSVSPELKRSKMSQPDPGSPERIRSTPKLKLRFTTARHAVPPPHPNAQPPSPQRPPTLSLSQRIEKLELREMQAPYTENDRGPPDMAWFLQRAEKQAAEEGAIRRKLLEEALPGGKLSKDKLSLYHDSDAQLEPSKQYGHNDHLVAHALHLRHLQLREKTQHRALAKKVAHEALDFWKAMRGPTEEDLREQEDKMFRLIYRQVVVDVRAKWDMVVAYVQQQRLRQWEAEEELKRQRRLQEKLEWSESMVARQRGEADSEMEIGEDSTGDLDASDDDDDDDDGDDDDDSGEEEENMSDSASEQESEKELADEGGEMNAAELEAYLRQRDEEGVNANSGEVGDDEGAVSEHGDGEETDEDEEEGDTSLAAMLDPRTGTGVQLGDASDEPHRIEDDTDGRVDSETEATNAEKDGSLHDDADRTGPATLRSQRSSPTPSVEKPDDLGLSSDESTDMDSDEYDSDEDMSSTGDEADAEGDDEDEEGEEDEQDSDDGRAKAASLLGFYSKHDIKAFGLPTPTTSAEGDERDRHVEPSTGDAAETHADVDLAQETDVAADVRDHSHDVEMQLASEQDVPVETASAPQTPASEVRDDPTVKQLVPNPSLLRGTLRSYQHAGLDWLASLYRNGTNGILADEMGLGKTIQTIALLAHLAEEHECWETHLIIVPTSVILNWVTEFQKFLPGFRVLGYYGTAEERAAKRRGWVNDPHHEHRDKRGYNAVITSYNVAMQDINAIRNVQWHYLVLDEAHNIRNFNSQRWQLLIRLKTRARLLLTGTPLQNSLTELWSLLTFLTAGDDDPAHGDLEEFLSHWKEPVKEIFDRGVQTLSNEAQKVIDQLHVSLRPFLLRRLKTEVEKDLPKKTESVVVCKLSKRQRQLYQDYMGLAETKRSLTQGNAVSAGKVLLSLRRVCNHPDLFDPRPIQTSFAMESSPLEVYSVRETLVRCLLGNSRDVAGKLMLVGNEHNRRYAVMRSKALSARTTLRKQVDAIEAENVEQPDPSTLAGCQALQKLKQRERTLECLRSQIRTQENLQAPVYGSDLRELLTVRNGKSYRTAAASARPPVLKKLRAWPAIGRYPLSFGSTDHRSDWLLSQSSILPRSIPTLEDYAERLQETIVNFAFCTPGATAPILDFAIPPDTQSALRACPAYPMEADYAHEARVRMAIAFPDSRLLIYDSGKLQRLTRLLRELQSRGSRSLIFTQMTGTLNILEQFLSLMNLPYLRLDGSTPVERRQLYSAEFNRPDSKYQCMILSSRAGGVGLNLVGASSVIFYDLDWNPQMDRQCMDRAHRIGQVRDVQVYKMVSEKTVEENILRRANQKSLLDQTVIQEGHFTTEYQQPSRQSADDQGGEEDDDVAAAIDRFLGTGANEKATTHALESVEDREDVQAAQRARKEEQNQDDADFNERPSGRGAAASSSVPPTPGMTPGPGQDEDHQDGEDEAYLGRGAHVDKFMIRHMERLLSDVPFVPPPRPRTGLDKKGRDRDRKRRKR